MKKGSEIVDIRDRNYMRWHCRHFVLLCFCCLSMRLALNGGPGTAHGMASKKDSKTKSEETKDLHKERIRWKESKSSH